MPLYLIRDLCNLPSLLSLVCKLPWRQVSQSRMWPLLVVFGSPGFNPDRALPMDRNHDVLRHSALKRALKASTKALSVGFPGP